MVFQTAIYKNILFIFIYIQVKLCRIITYNFIHTHTVRDLIDSGAHQGKKYNQQVAIVYSVIGRFFDRFVFRENPSPQESVQRLLGIQEGA